MFFEANLNQVLGWFGAGTVPVLAIVLAHRDLVLHVPCAQLHHRRLPRHGAARPVVHRFRLLHRPLSPARRRADHPLQHGGRPAREPLPHLGEVRLGRHPVHPRLRQEDPAGQSDGPGCRRRVRCPVAVDARRLVRRAGLRVPDLLRFLRLFRHGGGPGTDDRLRVPEELRFSLPGREHHGLLAALAHLAEHVLARLSLHSSGRQPRRARGAPTST